MGQEQSRNRRGSRHDLVVKNSPDNKNKRSSNEYSKVTSSSTTVALNQNHSKAFGFCKLETGPLNKLPPFTSANDHQKASNNSRRQHLVALLLSLPKRRHTSYRTSPEIQRKSLQLLQHFPSTHRRITMNSPFRGLRRAASSSSSSISCCSTSSACGTSTAPFSYPYPRTHSTVMVVPSARNSPNPVVLPTPPTAASSQFGSREWSSPSVAAPHLDYDDGNDANNNNNNLLYNFPNNPPGGNLNNNNNDVNGNTTSATAQPSLSPTTSTSIIAQYGFVTHRPRPPLNRAIPPIPESKSNESIISSQSSRRLSTTAQAINNNNVTNNNNAMIVQQIAEIIDENNPIDAPPLAPDSHRQKGLDSANALDLEGKVPDSTKSKPKPKASRLPKLRKKKDPKPSSSAIPAQKVDSLLAASTSSTMSASFPPPKSPLLSMAHSVKCRLTKLSTRLSRDRSTSPSTAMPMSKSLSGTGMRRELSSGEFSKQKSRILAGGKKSATMTSVAKSKSLETTTATPIGAHIQMRMIDEPSPARSLDKSQEVPRRMPVTTLIPTPIGGIVKRRLPSQEFDELFARHSKTSPDSSKSPTEPVLQQESSSVQPHNNEQKDNDEQLKPSPEQSDTIPLIATKVLEKRTELETVPFVVVPTECREVKTNDEKNDESRPTPDQSEAETSENRDKVIDESAEGGIPSDESPEEKPRVAGSDLCVVPQIHPVKGMRKSPQSFPPLSKPSSGFRKSSEESVRPIKSALSVSFGGADIRKSMVVEDTEEPKYGQQHAEESKQSKRCVFSTRSLRLVASRVCEASPILRRRNRSRSSAPPEQRSSERSKSPTAERNDEKPAGLKKDRESKDKEHKKEKENKKSAKKGTSRSKTQSFSGTSSDLKSQQDQVNDAKEYQKLTAKARRAESQPASSRKFELRSVHSVRSVPDHKRKAPLAESESMRVENSPAVEIPPFGFELSGKARPHRSGLNFPRFFPSKFGTKKPKADQKAPTNGREPPSAPPSSASRPTLAELLASPQTARKDNSSTAAAAIDSHRSGLIDDEIIDQPMLISASSVTDFPPIDDLSLCSSSSPFASHLHSYKYPSVSAPQNLVLNGNSRVNRSTGAVDVEEPIEWCDAGAADNDQDQDSSPSLLLVAEMRSAEPGEVTVVENRMEQLSMASRNARSRNDATKPTAASISDPSTSAPVVNGNKMVYCNGGADSTVTHRFVDHQQKASVDEVDLSHALPEMLSDFKGQLRELEDAIRKDNEEIETLRLQNEYLRRQLAERDQIIESLQRQLRGVQQ